MKEMKLREDVNNTQTGITLFEGTQVHSFILVDKIL